MDPDCNISLLYGPTLTRQAAEELDRVIHVIRVRALWSGFLAGFLVGVVMGMGV